jgi:hypothetical protein
MVNMNSWGFVWLDFAGKKIVGATGVGASGKGSNGLKILFEKNVSLSSACSCNVVLTILRFIASKCYRF